MPLNLRKYLSLAALGAMPVGLAPLGVFSSFATAALPPAPATGIAVVELFTSEGCSSCPPADKLLSDLAAEAERDAKPVYALSFHVDYWNYLGWGDPFSQAAFTDRQRRYADALGGGVYTPEMVVNGAEGFVGSKSGSARAALRKALARPADCAIRIDSASADAHGNVNVTYAVSGHRTGALLNLAVIEPEKTVPVRGGENGGRILIHRNVVRALRTLRLDAPGTGNSRISIPADAGRELRLIAFVQDPESLAITGAARADVRR